MCTLIIILKEHSIKDIYIWKKYLMLSTAIFQVQVPVSGEWSKYWPYIQGQLPSVQLSRSVVSDSLRLHGLQHIRLCCPSPAPRACSNSCPSTQWSHPTILATTVPFSSCFQSCPASGSFPMNQFFASGGQSVGVSASASVLQWIFRTDFPIHELAFRSNNPGV